MIKPYQMRLLAWSRWNNEDQRTWLEKQWISRQFWISKLKGIRWQRFTVQQCITKEALKHFRQTYLSPPLCCVCSESAEPHACLFESASCTSVHFKNLFLSTLLVIWCPLCCWWKTPQWCLALTSSYVLKMPHHTHSFHFEDSFSVPCSTTFFSLKCMIWNRKHILVQTALKPAEMQHSWFYCYSFCCQYSWQMQKFCICVVHPLSNSGLLS